MVERAFPVDSIESTTGERVFAAKIECSACGVVAFHARGRHKPPIATEQHFRNGGWFVGNGPRADKCPDCQKPKKPDLKVVKMEAAKAEPPREMSREDRRIVFAKIDELYLEEKTGYQPPWTDAAVARDLGVPRAWVSQVRDELFGPEGSNAEFDDFLKQAAPIIADLKNLQKSVSTQLESVRAICSRVDELERMSKRIEREIGRAS